MSIVGRTEDGRLVFCGAKVFLMKDVHGIDVAMTREYLSDQGYVIDAIGFINAAKKAGWKPSTILRELEYGLNIPQEVLSCRAHLLQ